MRNPIIGTAMRVGAGLKIFSLYGSIRRKIMGSQIAILMYHRVGLKNDNWSFPSLTEDSFKEQIEYFAKNAEILSLETLVELLGSKKSLPQKAVVLTFDDGYKDNYLHAYPLLKRHNIPATIFLATGILSKGEMFWWDKVGYLLQNSNIGRIDLIGLGSFNLQSSLQKNKAQREITEKLKTFPEDTKQLLLGRLGEVSGVEIPPALGPSLILSTDNIKEMHNGGITFGAHSVNHPLLDKVTLERAKWEVDQSKKDLENILGCKVNIFSFPNGNCSSELSNFLRETGFKGAVSISPGRLIKPNDDIFALGRIAMTDDLNESKMAFSGLLHDIKSILGQTDPQNETD